MDEGLAIVCSDHSVPSHVRHRSGAIGCGERQRFIKDKSGAVIPNASVTIRNEGTDESHIVQTDSDGHFAVPNLPPATYSMTAEAAGFNRFVSVHNPLGASTALDIDGALSPGSVSQTVEVTASAVVLQTESGSVQSEISGKTITDQQLNGRNPLFMGSLIPGMRSSTTLGDFNFAIGSSVPFNVNGAGSRTRWSRSMARPEFALAAPARSSASPIRMQSKRCRF